MYGRKIEIGINHKFIKKNNSPKSKDENISRILNKKEIKSNKPITKKFEFYINEKKSPSKANIFDEKIIKNNIIKKSPKKINVKKRQNKFFKKKMKEREPSSINSNLNIYKIINSKEIKCNKMPQSSSITTDSMNSYISNASNKINNNKCISLFQKTDNYNSYKRKRIDSDISNNSNNKNNFFINKDCSKIDNKNKNINININKSNKKKLKDSNQNIRINILSPKCKRNINLSNNQMNNNISDLSNNEYKTDIKIKGYHNNMKENKSEFNIIFNKNNNMKDNNNKFNIKKYNIYSKINNNKNINKEKCNNKKEDDNNNFNKNNNNYFYKEKTKTNKNNEINNENDENFVNIDEKININNNINNLNQGMYFFNLNNFSNKKMSGKKNLNPVKKSLFSEHMNFLINHQEEKNINHNNKINKNNFINIPFNSLLDSTDKKDYESKFINYDLGKTTGTSSSKDSFLVFGNKKSSEKNDLTKLLNNNTKNNYCINEQEKERTQEEIEKLAKEYINMSKNWENKDDYYKQNIIQTNTITTIIDNNNYNEESIIS